MADGTDDPTPAVDLVATAPTGRRRRALWGALAVLAIGGGALAVTGADDDPPRLPLALGAGTAEGTAAAAAADMSMMAWIEYVAGDDLPLLGEDGPAYRLSGEVDRADVERIADALGLDGTPTKADGAWTLEGPGGAVLQAADGAGGGWWYSSASLSSSVGGSAGSSGAAACPPDAAECTSTDGDTPVTTVYEPPPPPEDLPTKAEAERIARDLFDSVGADLDGAVVTVDGSDDGWYVTVEPTVDGLRQTGIYLSATVGSKGEVTSASGTVNTPERLGSYPTIDTHAAIDRLNESVAYGGGREAFATTTVPMPADGGSVAADDEVVCPTPAVDPAATGTTAVATDPASPDTTIPPDTPVSSGDVTSTCLSPEPYPVPAEPTEVVLHEAELVLVMVGASDGSTDAYLVPGYRMTGDDGASVDVPAVDDESLLPVDDVDGSTGSNGATEPATDPAVDPDGPSDDVGTTGPASRCAPIEPGPDGAVPDICLDPNSVPPVEPSVGTG